MNDIPEPTLEQLEFMNRMHRKDLRLLRHMTDAQFHVFRKNISIGVFEDMTKAEAYDILMSMLALNQHLIDLTKAKQK
jgi:hypothetical protein